MFILESRRGFNYDELVYQAATGADGGNDSP